MDYKTFHNQEETKGKYFKKKTTKNLEKELKALLCMDNNGGMLANDIIEELGKRSAEKELKEGTDDLKFPFIKTVELFLQDCNNFKVDKQTYDVSYLEFLKYFNELTTITKHHLVVSINFTYGWMPTIFDFRSDKFDEALEILNNAKKGIIPTAKELEVLKGLLNNSLVGTTKLLHFINPSKFAIWDSRVYRYLTGKEAYNHRIGNSKMYLKYLTFCDLLTQGEEYDQAHNSICKKLGYQMTKLRTAELIMYLNGGPRDKDASLAN